MAVGVTVLATLLVDVRGVMAAGREAVDMDGHEGAPAGTAHELGAATDVLSGTGGKGVEVAPGDDALSRRGRGAERHQQASRGQSRDGQGRILQLSLHAASPPCGCPTTFPGSRGPR